MLWKDNWFAWTYEDGIEYGPKPHSRADMNFILRNTITRPIQSHYEELCNNARAIRDVITGEIDLLFSGGVDSEVVLRTYLDLKIPVNVYIFKYENDYNLPDYTQATRICRELGVTPIVIDFNLEKFFENEAYDMWTKIYAPSSGFLPQLKMADYLDNTPIYATGDPYWRRKSKDWTQPAEWSFLLEEAYHLWALYFKTIGRTAITDWFEYSPELIMSYNQLPYVQELINDRIPGKLSTVTSKGIIHKEYWPTLELRNKLVGFGGPDENPNKLLPPFMLEFSKQYGRDKVTSKVVGYSEKELINKIGS